MAPVDVDPSAPPRFRLTGPPSDGVLVHDAHVGAGVVVGVDVMAPDTWRSITGESPTAANRSLLQALIGGRAVRALGRDDGRPLAVDGARAAPWVRVAVVDALDRWLQLPLDQSLVDAERGVSRGRAAHMLPSDDSARRLVVAEGLELARAGASGVRDCLRTLGLRRRPVPAGLLDALRLLVDGYADLVGEIQGRGTDRELTSVVDAWRALTATGGADGRSAARRRRAVPRARGTTSMIDPRQVRSRVFGLATDPRAGEVTMEERRFGGRSVVVVRVPAFRRAVDQHVVPRLLVRLVDTLTADPRGESVLTLSTPDEPGGRAYFTGVVPWSGSSTEHLRADVFDLLSDVPPATTDTDERLQEVRRATVFLSEWRRLVALTQLPAAEPAPGRRLRELARRLGGTDPDQPLFPGGPTRTDLHRLADAAPDDEQRFAPDRAEGLLRVVTGTGGLLVAELAALVL